jgi:RNA methyltransferase, TrmH family
VGNINKAQIKQIQALHVKKTRDTLGVFIAEGVKILQELLKSDFEIDEIFYTDNFKPIGGLKCTLIEAFEMQKISALQTPTNVLTVVNKPSIKNLNFENKITLVLDDIQDPGNLGAIMRIADWYGIQNIVCNTNSADAYAPKVVQASMGSLFRVAIFKTELQSFFQMHASIPVFATFLNGSSIYKINKITQGFIVIGNEGKGINASILPNNYMPITIPKIGQAESLNASVAAGIICAQLIAFEY